MMQLGTYAGITKLYGNRINFTKTINMYDNPDVMLEPMPEYHKRGVEPTGGQLVPDPLRGYANALEQYVNILQAHADKKYGAYVIHYPKDRHPETGEELDLIN